MDWNTFWVAVGSLGTAASAWLLYRKSQVNNHALRERDNSPQEKENPGRSPAVPANHTPPHLRKTARQLADETRVNETNWLTPPTASHEQN